MRSPVASLLDEGNWIAYEAWLLSRMYEFMDGSQGAIADLDRGLAQLEAIDPSSLFVEGTPFHWLNIHRLYRSPRQVSSQAARDFLMIAFDAYFNLLPDAAWFGLPEAPRQTVILPRLGIVIPEASHCVLRRLSSHTLEIEYATETVRLDLTDPGHPYRAPTSNVLEGPEKVIAIADSAILTETNDIAIGADLTAFSQEIGRALTFIGRIDRDLYRAIRKLIHWYVPLKMPAPFVHNSRSASGTTGVIHVSEGYSGIRLCEAVVHEYHHNELFVVEAIQRLVMQDPNTMFYSPWRPDPRPLSGLLHGLHVFSAVVKFYRRAEAIGDVEMNRDEVRQRRSSMCEKVRVGLLQVPRHALTPTGMRLIQAIDDELAQQQAELRYETAVVSDETLAHARTWCRANPMYAPNIKWPGDVHVFRD